MAPPHTNAHTRAQAYGRVRRNVGRSKVRPFTPQGQTVMWWATRNNSRYCGLMRNRQSSLKHSTADCSDTLKSLKSCGRLPPQSVDNGLTAPLSTGLRSAVQRTSTAFRIQRDRVNRTRPDKGGIDRHHSTSVDDGVDIRKTSVSTRGRTWPKN